MDNSMQPLQLAIKQIQNPSVSANPDTTLPGISQALLAKQQAGIQQANVLPQNYKPADIAQAIAKVDPTNKQPIAQIGKAIQTPNYAGYCLKWVDDQQGNTNRLPTAFADYQSKAAEGNINTSNNVPKGSRVYFSPDSSNGDMGHIGISNGDGTFTSATDNGIKTFSIKDWQKITGQSFLGWAK